MAIFADPMQTLVFLGAWVLIGPLFAIILSRLGEKRWGNGPTWGFLGFCFNIFALGLYFVLAGIEHNEASSAGAAESRRMAKIFEAAGRGRDGHRVGSGLTAVGDVVSGSAYMAAQQALDPEIEDLLRNHRRDEALQRAKERYAIAFQHGDSTKEEIYGNYVAQIVQQDEALRAKLAELQREM